MDSGGKKEELDYSAINNNDITNDGKDVVEDICKQNNKNEDIISVEPLQQTLSSKKKQVTFEDLDNFGKWLMSLDGLEEKTPISRAIELLMKLGQMGVFELFAENKIDIDIFNAFYRNMFSREKKKELGTAIRNMVKKQFYLSYFFKTVTDICTSQQDLRSALCVNNRRLEIIRNVDEQLVEGVGSPIKRHFDELNEHFIALRSEVNSSINDNKFYIDDKYISTVNARGQLLVFAESVLTGIVNISKDMRKSSEDVAKMSENLRYAQTQVAEAQDKIAEIQAEKNAIEERAIEEKKKLTAEAQSEASRIQKELTEEVTKRSIVIDRLEKEREKVALQKEQLEEKTKELIEKEKKLKEQEQELEKQKKILKIREVGIEETNKEIVKLFKENQEFKRQLLTK